MSLDLKKLDAELDAQLAKETSDSLSTWLQAKEKSPGVHMTDQSVGKFCDDITEAYVFLEDVCERQGERLQSFGATILKQGKENAALRAEVERLTAENERLLHVDLGPIIVSGDGVTAPILGEMTQYIVEAFAGIFKETGAQNYVEFQLKDKEGNFYTLHFQKTVRPTPHELRKQAEKEIARLRAELAEVKRGFEESHEVLFVRHIEGHLHGDQVPICKICGFSIVEIYEAARAQRKEGGQ